jgi:linalool dehydratase/isomerase-like protein
MTAAHGMRSPIAQPTHTGLLFVGGSIARRRIARTVLGYAALLMLATVVIHLSRRPDIAALALGTAFPGAGFLAWTMSHGSAPAFALLLCAGSIALFLAALVLWFATGNVVLPGVVWIGAAVAAFVLIGPSPASVATLPPLLAWAPAALLVGLAGATGLAALAAHRGAAGRARIESLARSAALAAEPAPPRHEIALDDLRRLRLLLDRALQPVDRFDGFEWRDQFQTAAVRYQVNFLSYALSMAAHAYLPAFDGYLAAAQRNLVAKQRDPRMWRYWALESLWGHLRAGRDPIVRDNIMYSGFLAAQIAFARSGLGIADHDAPGSLRLERASGASFAYSLPEIVEVLARQYRSARYGLLACEPNWIFPLCNLITASGIRAADAQYGTRHWDGIAHKFRHHLETDFTATDGRLLAFRSSLTGLGIATVGGAAMQAFQCFFLDAIFPDLAARHWSRLRPALTGARQRRAFWPIDYGNYGFARAASYAMTAAAAAEMGDGELAQRMLDLLETEHPAQLSGGVVHRDRASLWSHAVELIARLGQAGTLRSLVAKPRKRAAAAPRIASAAYPDVLVAEARAQHGALHAVLHAGSAAGPKDLEIAGLVPTCGYIAEAGEAQRFKADAAGKATLRIPVHGRTTLRIVPVG